MPQLDKFIFLSQFFWLFAFLFASYFFLVKYALPSILQTFKFRKLLLSKLYLGNALLSTPPSSLHFSLPPFDTLHRSLTGSELVVERYATSLLSREQLPLLSLKGSTFPLHLVSSTLNRPLLRSLLLYSSCPYTTASLLPALTPLLLYPVDRLFSFIQPAAFGRFPQRFGRSEFIPLLLPLFYKYSLDLYTQFRFALPLLAPVRPPYHFQLYPFLFNSSVMNNERWYRYPFAYFFYQ